MAEEIKFRYDTQLLIEGKDLDEDVITDYITANLVGDCLQVGNLRSVIWRAYEVAMKI